MSSIRVTAMLCVTALVIITGALMYANKQDRYVILPQNNAMFIFDRQNASVNYCTADQCRLVMPFGGATAMPGMAGMMPGMGMPMPGGMPTGFQPFAAPGGDPASMMMPTGMGGPAANQNNPMMMWAYMQAASAMAAQKGSFSSLQNQPSWMNIMAMMQPSAAGGKSVSAQSPIVPTAMQQEVEEEGDDDAAAPAGGDEAAAEEDEA